MLAYKVSLAGVLGRLANVFLRAMGGQMDKPQIDVLVPVYNVEPYLGQCMDSLVAQTMAEMTILCLDDGSKDGCGGILDEYVRKDARVKCYHRRNGGYGKTMNFGLRQARGEYVGIVESDDFVECTMFETLYALAKEHRVQVVKSDFYTYTDKTGDVKANILPEEDLGVVFCPRERSEIFYCQPSIWSAIYERDFLERCEIDFLESPGASYQDAGFNFKVWMLAERVYLTPEALVHYRCDREGASMLSTSKFPCIVEEWANIERFMERYPEWKKASYLLRNQLKLWNYMWNYHRLPTGKKREYRKVMQEEFGEALKNGGLKRGCYTQKTWSGLALLTNPGWWQTLSYWVRRYFVYPCLCRVKYRGNAKKYVFLGGLIRFKRLFPENLTSNPTFLEGLKG